MVGRRTEHRVVHDDPELDISSLDLGYVNIQNPVACAVYLARTGARRYKQGIDLNALSYAVLVPPGLSFGVSGEMMFCQGFLDAYEGKYPSLKEAIKLIGAGARSVALSTDVAVMRDKDLFKVFIKGDEVGWMKAGTTIVNVPKTDTSWLSTYFLERIEGWKIVEGVK